MVEVSQKPKRQPKISRRIPIGAESQGEDGAHFRVWAPRSRSVGVELWSLSHGLDAPLYYELGQEADGYFSGSIAKAQTGMLYKYRLDSGLFPDPVSRFQPQGPDGPSEIIDPYQFKWTDQKWKGVTREGQVIYEMHIGTFTKEGTWMAAAEELAELVRFGITIVEVMPVADFPGRFGWGYDGVDMFAPTHLYGRPDEFRAFINRAHELGVGVILDVVYNHFGPDGCFLKEFSEYYFNSRYACEWGEAINYDGEQCGGVREFCVSNAVYWIEEFHLDGFRFDATQQVFDSSETNILKEIGCRAREAAGKRSIYLSAENEAQLAKQAQPVSGGGYGLDAVWNDDFHHLAKVAITGHTEAYFKDYQGSPQEFLSAIKRGFLYQGQRYCWHKKRRGTPTTGMHPVQFIHFLQNHDQIANSLRGERMQKFSSPGVLRALTALLLLGPETPLLFQGQEFGSSARFLFFADHKPSLAKDVATGRRTFLSQFPSIATPEANKILDRPDSEETFQTCKLDFSERQKHWEIYKLHYDLLKLRREDKVLCGGLRVEMDGAVLGQDAFVLRFFGGKEGDRLLITNLGKDLHLDPAPEPLLAPPFGETWRLKWSSEDVSYGGGGTPPFDAPDNWLIRGRSLVVLESQANRKSEPRKSKKTSNHA